MSEGGSFDKSTGNPQESSDDRKKKKGGAPLEAGMRKALDRAPGLAAPAWSWMEGALQGGAVAAGAAQGARWILHARLGAAAVGGAMVMWGGYVWLNDDEDQRPEEQIIVEAVDLEENSTPDQDALSTNYPVSVDGEPLPVEPAASKPTTVLPDPAADPAAKPAAKPVDISHAKPAPSASSSAAPEETESVRLKRNWNDVPAEERTAFGSTLDAACVGAEVAFSTTHQLGGTRVLWNFGDGHFSADYTPSHVFNEAGVYDVTLSLTRNADGMIRTRTIKNMVTIHPKPTAGFSWEFPRLAADRPLVIFENLSTEAASSTWVFDGDLVVDEFAPAVEMERVGEHTVQLVVSNAMGCQATLSQHVEVGNRFGLKAPARFSPNGDDLYDVFLPDGLRNSPGTFVLRVSTPDGTLIYETTTIRKPWDGRLLDGSTAQSGSLFQWSVIERYDDGSLAYYSDVLEVE
jgi:hypothetical protein